MGPIDPFGRLCYWERGGWGFSGSYDEIRKQMMIDVAIDRAAVFPSFGGNELDYI